MNRVEPVWGLVANVADKRLYGPSGEIRSGTKHFAPGAKVYYHQAFWGMGADQVRVIGHHRGSNRLVSVVVARRHLHNWRAQLVYKPSVLRRLTSDRNEITNGPDDPEAEAKALATNFNKAVHFLAFDRSEQVVEGLVERWRLEGHEGLDDLTDFDADRWMVLYGGLDPVGVGLSNYSRSYKWWVVPGYESGWPLTLKPALERSLPEGEGSSQRLAYETGLSGADQNELSELMSAQFDLLHTLVFESNTAPDVHPLIGFSLPILRSRFMAWPPGLAGLEHEVLAGWLGGQSTSDIAESLDTDVSAVQAGFDAIRNEGYALAGAAVRLMKSRREYDSDEKASLAAVLARDRLQSGTNSALAQSLLRHIFHQPFGQMTFGRVAASALATEFRSRGHGHDRERFRHFALDWVSDCIETGQLQPMDSTQTTPSQRLLEPQVSYSIDDWPLQAMPRRP